MKRTDSSHATPIKTRRRSKKAAGKSVIKEQPRSVQNKKNIFSVYARLALGLGIICFLIVLNTMIVRTFPVPKPHNFAATAKKIPAEIIIKDAHIDLPIFPSTFSNGTFETTTKGASYLTTTPIPGDTGNSVIYAHNWANLFGNLHRVKLGDTITIIYNNNSQKNFTVTKTETVSAYQTSILQSYDDTRVTIFTCANFLDADRFVVTALPE